MLFAGKWMELENFMLRELSQTQKNIKGRMFSTICGSLTYKLNVHIETYMIMYTHTNIYIHIFVYCITESA
jgi:hypothetical protein